MKTYPRPEAICYIAKSAEFNYEDQTHINIIKKY